MYGIAGQYMNTKEVVNEDMVAISDYNNTRYYLPRACVRDYEYDHHENKAKYQSSYQPYDFS